MSEVSDEQRAICDGLEKLQDRAMRAGMPTTTRAIENAKNVWGWEISGDTTTAAALVPAKYQQRIK